MSKEITITCKSCGKKVKTTGSGDFSTFVCEECQEKINLPAYKSELKEYEALAAKKQITESQIVRAKYIKDKIAKIEKIK
jgi:endogenous inhibitor of DNA gyrase (YacG/DUF329 family)